MSKRRKHLDLSMDDFDGCASLGAWRAVIDRWEQMIPEQHRGSAVIECYDDYDSGLRIGEAYYEYEETELERQTREREEREAAARRQADAYARELAQYESLKKKFEPNR